MTEPLTDEAVANNLARKRIHDELRRSKRGEKSMKSVTLISYLGIAALLLTSCGGGGGSSPTAPDPPTLNVQGAWDGVWVAPITVSMNLNQPAGSSEVAGTISALGFTFQVRGSTVFSGPGSGSFTWQVVDGGCGSWTGTMAVSGSSMNGGSRLSTLGCAEPDVIEGRMFLSRAGAASAAVAVPGGSTGALEDLVRAGRSGR